MVSGSGGGVRGATLKREPVPSPLERALLAGRGAQRGDAPLCHVNALFEAAIGGPPHSANAMDCFNFGANAPSWGARLVALFSVSRG